MNKIMVFGSFVVDLMARAPHLPAPGETVKGSMFKMGPGGKGFNQAISAHKSGGDVTVVTKVGNDDFANVAKNMLKEQGMKQDFCFVSDTTPTGAALIMVDEQTSQNSIMVTLGACNTFDDDDIAKIKPELESSKVLLTQLETNLYSVEKVVDIAHNSGVKVVLNPAPVQAISDELYKKIDVITPNEVEAEILSGVKVNTEEDCLKAAEFFFGKGVNEVVITLGKKGVMAITKDSHKMLDNYDVKVLDTTGAGDAFSGGFVTAIADGKDIFDACVYGNVVSNLAVTKMGTSVAMPSKEEIDSFIENN